MVCSTHFSQHQPLVSQGGIDLLFYGDSLTELWRGTAWGYNSRLGSGIPAVFSRYFGQYRSVVCGSGGIPCLMTQTVMSTEPAGFSKRMIDSCESAGMSGGTFASLQGNTHDNDWRQVTAVGERISYRWNDGVEQVTQLQICGGASRMGSCHATTSRKWR